MPRFVPGAAAKEAKENRPPIAQARAQARARKPRAGPSLRAAEPKARAVARVPARKEAAASEPDGGGAAGGEDGAAAANAAGVRRRQKFGVSKLRLKGATEITEAARLLTSWEGELQAQEDSLAHYQAAAHKQFGDVKAENFMWNGHLQHLKLIDFSADALTFKFIANGLPWSKHKRKKSRWEKRRETEKKEGDPPLGIAYDADGLPVPVFTSVRERRARSHYPHRTGRSTARTTAPSTRRVVEEAPRSRAPCSSRTTSSTCAARPPRGASASARCTSRASAGLVLLRLTTPSCVY